MANEIQVPHPGNATGKSLYAIVRNNHSQAYVGTTAETYQTAHLSTYAIALAEQGSASRFYVGTFPSIAAGYYTLAVYDRQGSNPAEGDPVVAFGDVYWNGSVLYAPAGAGDAMALTSGERDAIANDVLDLANGVETGLTLRQALRLFAAALAGKISGAGSTTIVIRNAVADTKPRITATVDANGNRPAIAVDLS
jgi:hypothetical protein